MKKFKQLLFMVVLVSATVSCEKETPEISVQSITLNQLTADVPVGATLQLTATVLPENATNKTVTWSSGNETIATVSESGLVTGVKDGEVLIVAQAGDKTAICVVMVVTPVIPLANEWSYNGVRTPILNVATEVQGNNTYFFLNKNIPLDEESQRGVNGKIALVIPNASLGAELSLSAGATAHWAFDLLDTENSLEIKSNADNVGTSVGGTLQVTKSGDEYTIEGALNYADGKTLEVQYKGTVTDLDAFAASVHNGTGNLRWSFESADMPILATAYKLLKYNEGHVYEIFLYTGGNPIPLDTDWKEDLKGANSSIHTDVYNPKGVMLFVPVSFVAEGKTIELSKTQNFVDFYPTERRLPWAIYGMFGGVPMTDKPGYPFYSRMLYGFEDKVKLGAASLGYTLTGTMTIKKSGGNWDITLENISMNNEEGKGRIFSGEYKGSMESWSEYGFGAPRIWIDEWLLFGPNAL